MVIVIDNDKRVVRFFRPLALLLCWYCVARIWLIYTSRWSGSSQLCTPVPPSPHLPLAQPRLYAQTYQARHHDASTITHGRRTQRKLSFLFRNPIADLSERIDIDETTQKAFPKDDRKHDIDRGEEKVKRLENEDEEVKALKEGRRVEAMDSEEGQGGAGEEDAKLVDCLGQGIVSETTWPALGRQREQTYCVRGIKGAVLGEWR